MKILCFDKEVGKNINAFGSNFIMSKIGSYDGKLHIGCMHLGEGGLIGRHEATTNQLFLVVSGKGWVSDATDNKTPIKAGEAAFWVTGESHETGTETNMTALVIEGDKIDPTTFMKEKLMS